MGALVVLAAEAGSVTPGEEVRSVVLVRNTGATADEFHVAVQGAASKWAEVSPSLLRLGPGEEEAAWLTFAPPRSAAIPTGTHGYAVAVTCRGDSDYIAVEEGMVEIAPFKELAARLSAPGDAVNRAVPFILTIANRGNHPDVITVRAVATDEGLGFTIDPPAVEIPPGESVDIDVVVHRPRRLVPGGADAKRFSLRIGSGNADVAIIEAKVDSASTLGRDLRRSAVVLAVVLILLVLAGQTLLNDESSSSQRPSGVTLEAAPPNGENAVTGEEGFAEPTPTTPPAATPPTGRAVLVRTYSDGKDIVVRDDNGAELRLVSAKVEERRPALSPDGKQVAFVGTEVGKATRVCVISAAGGTYFCLANAALDSSLAWSADGASLFFARDQRLYSVAVAAPPSPAPTEVDRGVAVTRNNFSMNPARTAIVTPVGAGLEIRPLDGSPATALTARGQPANVAWSPSGDLVAFDDGNEVWVTEARTGGAVRQITQEATVQTEATWSRDGAWLVYRSNATGNGDLYAVRSAPGAPAAVRITTNDAPDLTPSL